MDDNSLQLLIQGGAVGISILLIALIFWLVKSYNKILSNHLSHLDKTLGGVEETIRQSNEDRKQMTQVIDTSNKLAERVLGVTNEVKGYLHGRRKRNSNDT